MEKSTEKTDVVLLFDYYSEDSQKLHTSFKLSGMDCKAVVINDEGFLPKDVVSVYGYFLKEADNAEKKEHEDYVYSAPKREENGHVEGTGRFFNQISIPDYWEITASNTGGKINDLSHERGRIYFAEPLHERIIKVVDWCDDKGVVRSCDHYDSKGYLYARTIFDAKGNKVNKSYFSKKGIEVIVENFVTRDIILNESGKVFFFRNKADFVKYFLRKNGLEQAQLFFNSLSTPFFVSESLVPNGMKDVLFWQENVGDEIPGNMKLILDGKSVRTNRIFVQKAASYDRLAELGASLDIISPKGYVYPFKRENSHTCSALICTNSDQIESLTAIVEAMPQMNFYIAAITEMSSVLMAMAKYKNIYLYPAARISTINELFAKCNFYLDINYGNQIVSAVNNAFLNNQLIYAFKETVHNADYIAKEHIYSKADSAKLISALKEVTASQELLDEHLKMQRAAALSESEQSFIKSIL